MDELNKRIIDLMVKSGHSKSTFAKELGVSLPLITHITSGRNKPGLDIIQKIMSTFPDLNPDWLINGTGEIYRVMPKKADLSGVQAKLNNLKQLTNKPQETLKTMIDFHKILMDEILHLQEMAILIEEATATLQTMNKQIEQIKIDIESEVNS